MAVKRKDGSVGAIFFPKMNFFHPSVSLHEENGEAVINREHFEGLTIIGGCKLVFSHHSQNECNGYESVHPGFPDITF